MGIGGSKKDKPKTDSSRPGGDSSRRDKDGSASSKFDKMENRKDFSEVEGLSSERKAKYTPRDNPLSIMLAAEQPDDIIEKPKVDLASKIAACKDHHPGLGGRESHDKPNEILEDISVGDSALTPAQTFGALTKPGTRSNTHHFSRSPTSKLSRKHTVQSPPKKKPTLALSLEDFPPEQVAKFQRQNSLGILANSQMVKKSKTNIRSQWDKCQR